MAKKEALTKEKAGHTPKKTKKRNKKEIIIIVAVALILALIDAALVAAVVKYMDEHPHGDNAGNGSGKVEYPEYSKGGDTKTEGKYFDATKTGAGVDVDMAKVKSQIDAYEYDDFVLSNTPTDFVVIRVEDYGDIVLALREDIAPLTVNNFKALVLKDFYDNLTIHRAVKDLLIEGGIKDKAGEDKTASPILGEFAHNGVENNLSHAKGVISMSREKDSNNTATSEFFIMNAETTKYDGSFATFGYVLAGLDIVDAIANCQVKVSSATAEKSVPVNQIVIKDVFFVEPKANTGIATNTASE